MKAIEITDSDGDTITVERGSEFAASIMITGSGCAVIASLDTTAIMRQFADDLRAMADAIDVEGATQ